MMTIDQVDALRDQLLADGTPKPDVIRQIALDCLDWPYVFGAWGGKCTPSGRKKWYNLNPSHTTIKTKCPSLNSGAACSTCKWGIGVRMFDCRGFTRWLLQQVGLDIVNSKGQVCQTVTQEGERNTGVYHHQTGQHGKPPGRRHEILPFADHRTPVRCGRRDPDAQIPQCHDDHQQAGHVRHQHNDGLWQHVREDLGQDDPQV